MVRAFCRVALLAGLTFTSSAHAGSYSGIFAFGDSLSDAGNVAVLTAGTPIAQPRLPYYNGMFSNGPVWVQDLAAHYGLGPLSPSLLGGNDYAYGDGQTGLTAVNPVGPTNFLDLPSQLNQFHSAHASAPSGALYTLWIGANDLQGVLQSVDPIGNAALVLPQAIANIDSFVNGLAGLGAKDLLLLNVSDLGLTPAIRAFGPAVAAFATQLVTDFNTALTANLTALAALDGLNLTLVDTQSLTDKVVASPAGYGFTNVTDPCFTGTATGGPASGTLCGATLAQQDTHLFWDDIHPTAAGHAGIALAAETALPEPASLLLLAGGLAALAVTRRRKAG